ncbi:hypothetical protein D3C84_1135810 [compost metagenome]
MRFHLGSFFEGIRYILVKAWVWYFSGKDYLPILSVDPKIEVSITIEEGADTGFHLQFPKRSYET